MPTNPDLLLDCKPLLLLAPLCPQPVLFGCFLLHILQCLLVTSPHHLPIFRSRPQQLAPPPSMMLGQSKANPPIPHVTRASCLIHLTMQVALEVVRRVVDLQGQMRAHTPLVTPAATAPKEVTLTDHDCRLAGQPHTGHTSAHPSTHAHSTSAVRPPQTDSTTQTATAARAHRPASA